MRTIVKIFYGSGQIYKDLLQAVLNVFSIVYFEDCLRIPSVYVGTLLLIGQCVNALSTPIIGLLSQHLCHKKTVSQSASQSIPVGDDRPVKQSRSCCWRMFDAAKQRLNPHKHKAWHCYGNLIMMIGFPTMFSQSESFIDLPVSVKLAVMGCILIALQIGWGLIQVSHLTLVNFLTDDRDERVLLVSMRYFFAALADISTFLLSYILLVVRTGLTPPSDNSTTTTKIPPVARNDTIRHILRKRATDLSVVNASLPMEDLNKITTKDMPLFRNIVLSLTVYGLIFFIIFQVIVPEPDNQKSSKKSGSSDKEANDEIDFKCMSNGNTVSNMDGEPKGGDLFESTLSDLNSIVYEVGSQFNLNQVDTDEEAQGQPNKASSKKHKKRSSNFAWYTWFTVPKFWTSCLIFCSLRLSVTISLTYLSPFLLESLKMEKQNIVLFPLAIYCTALVATLVQQRLGKLIGRIGNILVGVVFKFSFSIIIFFCEPRGTSNFKLYSAAVLLGLGNTFNNVSAIVVISDLIGTDQLRTAAFVHGFTSLTDKLGTGITIQLIQYFVPVLTYIDVEVYVVSGMLLVGLLVFAIEWISMRGIREDRGCGNCCSHWKTPNSLCWVGCSCACLSTSPSKVEVNMDQIAVK